MPPFTDKDHYIRSSKTGEGPFNYSLTDYIHIDTHAGGGASVVHIYQDELSCLDQPQLDELATMFFEEVFREDKRGNAHHVMGIVHRAAAYLPELVSYLGETQPDLDVKVCLCIVQCLVFCVCVCVCVFLAPTMYVVFAVHQPRDFPLSSKPLKCSLQ